MKIQVQISWVGQSTSLYLNKYIIWIGYKVHSARVFIGHSILTFVTKQEHKYTSAKKMHTCQLRGWVSWALVGFWLPGRFLGSPSWCCSKRPLHPCLRRRSPCQGLAAPVALLLVTPAPPLALHAPVLLALLALLALQKQFLIQINYFVHCNTSRKNTSLNNIFLALAIFTCQSAANVATTITESSLRRHQSALYTSVAHFCRKNQS